MSSREKSRTENDYPEISPGSKREAVLEAGARPSSRSAGPQKGGKHDHQSARDDKSQDQREER
jgi:hypothetical protein